MTSISYFKVSKKVLKFKLMSMYIYAQCPTDWHMPYTPTYDMLKSVGPWGKALLVGSALWALSNHTSNLDTIEFYQKS
jgi:hypothetical protein